MCNSRAQKNLRFETLDQRNLLATFSGLNQQLQVDNTGLTSLDYWQYDDNQSNTGSIAAGLSGTSNMRAQFSATSIDQVMANDGTGEGFEAFPELLWVLDQGPS